MRASILIGVHNEGDRLWRTVESVFETMGKLDAEVLVADDGSTDDSLAELKRRFPRIVVVEGGKRIGVGAARGLAASRARGETLIFLDGHTKPEAGALQRLVSSVEKTKGEAVITPQIIGLDETTWKSHPQQIGHGYALDLETFDSWWLPLKKMREVKESRQSFFESPALVGCALAVGRELYDRLWGFDPHMRQWGNEDLDFALKAWTMGARVLHDPEATVAHRFQRDFADYEVNAEYPLANQIRSARKHFTQSVWEDWLVKAQQQQRLRLKGHPEGLWSSAWEVFQRDRQSAEHERAYLLSHRVKDEFWFARHFDRSWPAMGGAAAPVLLKQAPLPPHVLFAEAMGTPPPPVLASVTPNQSDPGTSPTVTLAGTFPSPVNADSAAGIEADGSSGGNPSTFNATYYISSSADPSTVGVTVTDNYSQTSNSVPFTIGGEGGAPVINPPLDPPSGTPGNTVTVEITGSNFDSGTTVALSPGTGVMVGFTTFIDSSDMTVDLEIDSGAPTGIQQLSVTTSVGLQSNSVPFYIGDAPILQIYSSDTDQPLTGTQTVTIGEAISIYVLGSDGSTPTDITWDITSGSTVKTYTFDTSLCSAQLSSGDLQQQTLRFYWIEAGTSLEIDVTATVGGVVQSASVTYDVIGPSMSSMTGAQYKAQIKNYAVNGSPVNNAVFAGLGDIDATGNFIHVGIRFTFIASVPSGVTGSIGAIQLKKTQLSFSPSGCQSGYSYQDQWYLDTRDSSQFLYARPAGQSPTVTLSGTSTTWSSVDTPNTRGPIASCTEIDRSMSFQTYFVYKSDNPDSIWVTLGVLNWDFSVVGSRPSAGSNVWSAVGSPSPSSEQSVTGSSSSELPTCNCLYIEGDVSGSDCNDCP